MNIDWSQPATWVLVGVAIALGEALYGFLVGLIFGPPRCSHCGARHKRPSLYPQRRDDPARRN